MQFQDRSHGASFCLLYGSGDEGPRRGDAENLVHSPITYRQHIGLSETKGPNAFRANPRSLEQIAVALQETN